MFLKVPIIYQSTYYIFDDGRGESNCVNLNLSGVKNDEL
jgi:hypothetical protein